MEEATTYFEVTVEFAIETEDRKGNVKLRKTKEKYLVEALSVEYAERAIHGMISSQHAVDRTVQITAIRKSPIMAVLPYHE